MWEKAMIWENSTETYTLPCVEQMASASSMHEAEHPKPVLWDNPEAQSGEGGGGGSGRATHVYPWLIHVAVRQRTSQYCNYPQIEII